LINVCTLAIHTCVHLKNLTKIDDAIFALTDSCY